MKVAIDCSALESVLLFHAADLPLSGDVVEAIRRAARSPALESCAEDDAGADFTARRCERFGSDQVQR
jgi:hypothetical protein